MNSELKEIIKEKCDFTKNTITVEMLKQAEELVGVKFGTQLIEYILEYGYLGFEDIEFYGINSKQGLNSDLLDKTLNLHNYFEKTKPYIAFELISEHVYSLIDTDDNIYIYNDVENTLKPLNKKLFEYIVDRIKGDE